MVDEAGDDRATIGPGDPVLLVVENDIKFAHMVLEAAHEHGFKVLITGFGATALGLASQYALAAITLDISLPDINGWRVLDRLKHTPATRHIPVYVITTDEDRERGLRAGALGVATKPIQTQEALDEILATLRRYRDQSFRALMLIEPDAAHRERLRAYLPAGQVELLEAGTAGEALALIEQTTPDCVVLNPSLPDMSPEDFVERFITSGRVSERPVLVYGRDDGLSESEATAVRRLAQAAVVRDVHRPERLLDLTALFLHRPLSDLSEAQRLIVTRLHEGDQVLARRKVLIVDDDIRNIFALTSVLEQHQMIALPAETGRDAIAILRETPDVDLVLMDVMMPELDGLDTMRAIREIPGAHDVPIIAVTAKAMKGDREKCIEAGAWDYLAKPVDPEELLAVLRAWLVR